MGLTNTSTGRGAAQTGMQVERRCGGERVIALAGNPNVGKSTLFNTLTGMHQHTGNWPGKTVCSAQGSLTCADGTFLLVDIPGTYSLSAHSAEEEVARDFLMFGNADGIAVVCDATCLERNLNLVLQITEITPRTAVIVNLMDEAERRHIAVNLPLLERRLGVPVIGTVAHQKTVCRDAEALFARITDPEYTASPYRVRYPDAVEEALSQLVGTLETKTGDAQTARMLALKLIEDDATLHDAVEGFLGTEFFRGEAMTEARRRAAEILEQAGLTGDPLRDAVAGAVVRAAQTLCREAVSSKNGATCRDRRVDRVLTGRILAYPTMLLLLTVVFWITISGANTVSAWLSSGLETLLGALSDGLQAIHTPAWLHGLLTEGILRVLFWVVSVMLPPMAIFFPLFTLLEDVGYLPRVAYNLDRPFRACHACGKQALTMCMGFGCNAAGVVGCRIIDSPRERMLALLTNTFVPCNGRFPAILTLLAVFFTGTSSSSVLPALLLTGVIVLGVGITFLVTRLLSATLLRGTPSSFTLELPPYRRPQIGKILVRSVLDRTLFVLGRAAAVAAPAGALLWILSNTAPGGVSLLASLASFFDPLGALMGLDGVIFAAFLLGFPANEIVLPIILMAYLSNGALQEITDAAQISRILTENGWSALTAVCFILFSLMHWPCSTTVLTVRKESGSWRWTALSVLIPTLLGIAVCAAVAAVWRLFV